MKTYSDELRKCPVCGKVIRGYVPKGGDGSGCVFPRHKTRTRQREKTWGYILTNCPGGLIDFELGEIVEDGDGK